MKDKAEGVEDVCFCGTNVISHEVEYKGEKKQQWQNYDGKAHYNYNAQTKKMTCNVPEDSEAKTDDTQKTLAPSNDPDIEDIDRIHALEAKVVKRLKELDMNDPVKEKVGMYVKLLRDKKIR